MPELDVVIFGGGSAGLWLLDELRRSGYAALLVESRALGFGQTIGCQGIIHGGLKYMFDGKLNPSASAVSAMPDIWRQCLAGQRQPDLRATLVRSPGCYIWGTGSLKSKIILTGSAMALRTAPQTVDKANWPAALKNVSGKVLFVAEPVIDPVSLMANLGERNQGYIHRTDAAPTFERDAAGRITRILLPDLELRPTTVIFAAGEGNQNLRERVGLPAGAMQRRALHMVMARGPLPELFGHCIAYPRPRLTVTSTVDSSGKTVWLLGGQIAEDGVAMDAPKLVAHAAQELGACIPGIDLTGVQLGTYRVDRAEATTASGFKPDDVQVVQEGNVLTAWPTKMVLAPSLAERVLKLLPPPTLRTQNSALSTAPAPVATPPWEGNVQWFNAD